MSPNPNSYRLGGVRVLFPPDPESGDVALGFDTDGGVVRLRVPLTHFRYLVARGNEMLHQFDLMQLQSPISSGMASADGSPKDGHDV